MNKIAIIHFQPLEKYPPVMNLINDIVAQNNVHCRVYSTNNKNGYKFIAKGVKISRVATIYENSVLRYFGYIKFNISTFIKLLSETPQIIVAFEAYSVLPIYWYILIFKKTKSFIHYHEYISQKEINESSLYTKLLNSIEKKIYKNCNYVSQTNEQRAELFLKDFSFVDSSKMLISPNFPPKEWYEFAEKNKKKGVGHIIKLVHVGALSLNTMYTKEIVEWVIAQDGKYTIDFYTDNIATSAKKFFDSLNNQNVRLLDAVNYFDLPQILISYDIGVTLYNGHIPNYVYNVPNKVLEYLACGLNVWYSKDLISSTIFVEKYAISGCYETDFLNFDNQFIRTLNSKTRFNENIIYYNLISKPKTITTKMLDTA